MLLDDQCPPFWHSWPFKHFMLRPYVYSQEGTSVQGSSSFPSFPIPACLLNHPQQYCMSLLEISPYLSCLVTRCSDTREAMPTYIHLDLVLLPLTFLDIVMLLKSAGRLPLMEIIILLERTKVEPNKRIKFQTCYGMPMKGGITYLCTSRHE